MKTKKYSAPVPVHSAVRSMLREQFPAIILYVLLSVVLFTWYPDPYLTSDSGEYINSAVNVTNNPYRPIGYAIFLAFAHFFSATAQAVPVFQGFVYLAGLLFFVYQLTRVVELSRRARMMLGIVLVVNPLPLFYAHHFLSDSLFASCTLFFLGSILRYYKHPSIRTLLFVIAGAGMSLMVRHVGLFYMVFSLLVVLVVMGKKSLNHLAALALGCGAIILAMCFKMQSDLGVFRLNTFDGWTLWAASAKYIDLRPEYRASVTSPELRELYDYFASFPPGIYTTLTDLQVQWSPDSPAKKLLMASIQANNMGYYDAYIFTNDKLSLISKDIILHRPIQYFLGSFVPAIVKGWWPDMMLDDTGWKNYPDYPVPAAPDRIIQQYYHQASNSWRARSDLFPSVKPFVDIWTRAMAPLTVLSVALYGFFRKQLSRPSDEAKFLYLGAGFILLYIISIASLSTIYTRYLVPTSVLMSALVFVGSHQSIQFLTRRSLVTATGTPI